MKKITILIFVFLLLQFASLPSSVSADGTYGLFDDLLVLLVGLINSLKKLLGSIYGLGDIDYKDLEDSLKKLDSMGIKVTREQLVKKANEVSNINKEADGVWEAKLSFEYLLPEDLKRNLFGKDKNETIEEDEPTTTTVPPYEEPYGKEDEYVEVKKRETRFKRATTCTYKTEFDSRDAWPKCTSIINNVVNQGQCGSCWAVSTASAFTDCFCIERAKRGINTPNDAANTFSALDVLSCSKLFDGCDGGRAENAFNWMKNKGVCTGTDYSKPNGCKPYPFEPFGETQKGPKCSNACTNTKWGTPYKNDKQHVKYTGTLRGEQAIIDRLRASGSVVAGIDIYSDFDGYKTGVYFKTPGAKKDKYGHYIVIIGYGTQTCGNVNTKYWIARNSWGKGFGESGFMKFRRGVNECGIERDSSYGIP